MPRTVWIEIGEAMEKICALLWPPSLLGNPDAEEVEGESRGR